MKNLLLIVSVLYGTLTFAQDKGYFFGGFESNTQWLLNDEGLNFDAPEDQLRSNNYFRLDYNLGKITAGVQYESYLPSALLGYSPVFDGNNAIGTYYLNFKHETIDITAGYFYQQFGSGLILRSWEDRQLGINNALKGIRVIFTPTDYLDLTGIYGKTRNGFDVSEGITQGIDANFNISEALNIDRIDLDIGASYVGRYQNNGTNDTIPSIVNAYGGRLNFVAGDFYGGLEAIIKDPDVIANEGQLSSNKLYDGTAMQVDLGYAKKGLGINATFRRLENFSFYADRLAEGNIYNQELIGYTPALTKQQDYMLTNIYVYNAQPRLIIETYDQRAGEVGTQIDLYYNFKKGTLLGGKYGTKVAGNFSYWAGLDAEYHIENRWYKAEFIGNGSRLFRDFSVEVKKKLNKKWSSVATFQNVIVDKGIVYGGPLAVEDDIQASIAVLEGTYKIKGSKSVRFVVQHLWAEKDRKNWAAGVLEYNINSNFALYLADNWNYGDTDIHYYSAGGSYSKGRTRFAMNYGRQRGGLICIGGVCRFVPENTGLTANLTVNF
jgi:hypothetical protein